MSSFLCCTMSGYNASLSEAKMNAEALVKGHLNKKFQVYENILITVLLIPMCLKGRTFKPNGHPNKTIQVPCKPLFLQDLLTSFIEL